MTELKMEHILMFVVAAFLLYHLLGSCGCGNGFSVGGNVEIGYCGAIGDLGSRKPGCSHTEGDIHCMLGAEDVPGCTTLGLGYLDYGDWHDGCGPLYSRRKCVKTITPTPTPTPTPIPPPVIDKCTKELKSLCLNCSSISACKQCYGTKQSLLRNAGCTSTNIDDYITDLNLTGAICDSDAKKDCGSLSPNFRTCISGWHKCDNGLTCSCTGTNCTGSPGKCGVNN